MAQLTQDERKKLYRKHKLVVKKYDGDDVYSWAVFRNGRRICSGCSRMEADYNRSIYLDALLSGEIK